MVGAVVVVVCLMRGLMLSDVVVVGVGPTQPAIVVLNIMLKTTKTHLPNLLITTIPRNK